MSPLLATRAGASAQSYGIFAFSAPTGFNLIQQLLPSASSSVTFSSIPSTYKELQIRFNLILSGSGGTFALQFNGDTSSNYWWHRFSGNGATSSAGGAIAVTNIISLLSVGGVATYPNAGIVDIIDYANTSKNKVTKAFTGANNNAAGASPTELSSGLWMSTSAINSITFAPQGVTMTGAVSLYGVA